MSPCAGAWPSTSFVRNSVNDGLDSLTLKELRAKAKELGVRGTHRKGITKTEVRELVKAAA